METDIWYSLEDFIHHYDDFRESSEQKRREKLLQERDYYHRDSYFPEWVEDEVHQFKMQVLDMASPTKSLKATDTFKVQAGYPHEVEHSNKTRLNKYGITHDKNMALQNKTIPKLDAQLFTPLICYTYIYSRVISREKIQHFCTHAITP